MVSTALKLVQVNRFAMDWREKNNNRSKGNLLFYGSTERSFKFLENGNKNPTRGRQHGSRVDDLLGFLGLWEITRVQRGCAYVT